MMEFKWIEKYYQDESLEAYKLKNIHFKVRDGEYVRINRPNDKSKSTLLYVFGKLESESGCEYLYYEKPPTSLNRRNFAEFYNSQVGFVFQKNHFIADLTVRENLELPLLIQGISEVEIVQKINKIMKRLKITEIKNLYPYQLTQDQIQVAAVALAIICKPKIIFADEPTANLKPAQSDEVMNILSELNENGTTIVLATHVQSSDTRSDKVIALDKSETILETANEEYFA